VYDLGGVAVAVVLLDGDDLGGAADGVPRQLRLQDLEQHVSPDAAELDLVRWRRQEIHVSCHFSRGGRRDA